MDVVTHMGEELVEDAGDLVDEAVETVELSVSETVAQAEAAVVEAWDRGTTLLEYQRQATWRRVRNPSQTLFDKMTYTMFLEDLSAFEGILIEDGELYNEGPYCGVEMECLVGVSVPSGSAAITVGHNVRFRKGHPDDLVAHEMQHVYDIEAVGAATFYSSYLYDWVREGRNYYEIKWEERGYHVHNNYPSVKPRGLWSTLWDRFP